MPESLAMIAELGIGLAGFSSIVVAIGLRSQGLRPLDRMRVVGLLLGALGAALFAALPAVLSDADTAPGVTWGVSSAALALFLGGLLLYGLLMRRSLTETEFTALHPAMWILIIGGNGALIPLLIWNAAGVHAPPTAGPHLAALYYLLVYASIQFFRLLLVRPAGSPDA